MKRAAASHALALAFGPVLLLLAGCGDYVWYAYRDDPYLAETGGKAEGEVMRGLNSPSRDERQIAIRLLAQRAAAARSRRDIQTADRIDEVVIRRYTLERDNSVRACVVRLYAPVAGRGSNRVVEFLRGRIAAGEFPGYAALSLAAIRPRSAFQDIEPLTRHPDTAVRYQAAVALTVLGDPRGFDPVARVWRGMTSPPWPGTVEEMDFAVAKTNLERQAARSFGRPLY